MSNDKQLAWNIYLFIDLLESWLITKLFMMNQIFSSLQVQ